MLIVGDPASPSMTLHALNERPVFAAERI